MKVRLNLATSPLESNRRFTVTAMLISVFAVAALIGQSARAYTVWRSDNAFRTRQSGLELQISRLQQQRQGLAGFFDNPSTIARRQRAAYLNSLIQQRAFPWIKIFMDLERILPEGARVVSIEPKLVGDNVQLKVEIGATSDESKLRFLKALEQSAEFSHIVLLSESRPTNARPDQTDRVVLQIEAQYSVI